jgi:hypothetical protein
MNEYQLDCQNSLTEIHGRIQKVVIASQFDAAVIKLMYSALSKPMLIHLVWMSLNTRQESRCTKK